MLSDRSSYNVIKHTPQKVKVTVKMTVTMNKKQQKLYDNLLELTKLEPGFYFSHLSLENEHYRIFSYRMIPKYSKWLINGAALECRGTTFRMDNDNNPVALASWPFEKFFNLNENPMTQDLDLSSPMEVLVKEDGSLISSMLLPSGKLFLKSKASFTSKEAKAANELITTPQWKELYDWTLDWASQGYTVIMEYMSPLNKIVVPYSESKLTVLGVRDHSNGTYVNLFDMELPKEIQMLVIKNLVNEVNDTSAFVQSIKNQTELEGYVVRLKTGQRIKIKTNWYNRLHQNRRNDQDLSDMALAKLVLDQSIDDVRSAYAHSPEAVKRIDEITQVVSGIYNDTVAATTSFYETHKHFNRRDYALMAKKELPKYHVGIVMQLFAGKTVNFGELVHQHLKKKGIQGITVET
jgi:RNA ligase